MENFTIYSALTAVYAGDEPTQVSQAIRSVLEQTVKPDEYLIIVDGPIPEPLRALLEDFREQNASIRIEYLPENIGLGRVSALGVELCKHEFIMKMDADDISLPERAEKTLAVFEQNPELDIVSSNMAEFINDDPTQITSHRLLPSSQENLMKFAKKYNPMNHNAAIFRKSAILDVGNYQDFNRHEDYHLAIRLLMAGKKLETIQDSLLLYRISPESLKRKRSWDTVKTAMKFHRWKCEIGFTGRGTELYMDVVNLVACAIPDRIFWWIWTRLRK